MVQIKPEAMIAAACAQTGLDDFGGNSFREGLGILCDAVSAEAQLNGFGEMALPGAMIGALSNRLRVTDWIKRHPAVRDEQIAAPLVVVGMFRAGTTLLTYLLERDERHRPLFRWEAGNSVPPPMPDTLAADPRIDKTRQQMAMMDQVNPRMRVVQSEEPDGPTECISILNQDFKSLTWEAMVNVPAYGKWLHGTDHRSAYDYHKQVLQLLQSGGVRREGWSLKSPHHALHLDALTAAYPDARLILMHRDPLVLATSVCSLITTLTKTFSDADHKAFIARHWTDMLARSIDSVNAFRDANPQVKIVDIHYAELSGDPIATMRRIYDAIGQELDGQALAAMTAHIESRPKGRHGKHGYSPEEFGLNAGEIAERFKPYIERYGISLEMAR